MAQQLKALTALPDADIQLTAPTGWLTINHLNSSPRVSDILLWPPKACTHLVRRHTCRKTSNIHKVKKNVFVKEPNK